MDYESFLALIKEELKSYLDEENKNCAVNVRRVLKNNGIELDALTIVSVNCRTSPTVYLNKYYDDYLEGRTLESIAEEIYELISQNAGKISIDVNEFSDFSKMKKTIAYKVINADKNKKLLRRVPHVKRMDLAIVFYCIIKCNSNENATTLIYNQHLDLWKVGVEEVYQEAMKNTPRLLPYEIKSMGDIIKEMIEETGSDDEVCEDGVYGGEEIEVLTDRLMEELEADEDIPKMYVLTNKYRLNGAASMFYKGVLKQFADEHEADLIILPSSIHEVILIPMEPDMKPEDFRYMIREVNKEEVDPSEILSNHAYVYSRADDNITY